jgi:glucose/arabinose dehydrogenase
MRQHPEFVRKREPDPGIASVYSKGALHSGGFTLKGARVKDWHSFFPSVARQPEAGALGASLSKCMRPFLPIWCAVLFAATPVLHAAPGDAPATALRLQPHDRIVVLGNATADAFFQDGYFETLLHLRFPDHRLQLRNLAFPGDTAKGLGTPAAREQWLKLAAPDVLLVCYGGAESFAGEQGLAAFRTELAALLKKAAALERSSRTPLRLAVCGPAAVDVSDAAPEAKELNAIRKLYSEAAAAVATEAGVPFLDLFSLTQELFATGPQRSALLPALWGAPANALQTSTGLLTREAHRLLAPKIFQALFNEQPPNLPPEPADTPAPAENLRATVTARQAEWLAAYRPAAGGPPPKDWPQIQTRCDRHDPALWALAKGEPPAAEAKPASPAAPPSPSDTAPPDPAFKVQAGLSVQSFADSARFPELANPVQLGWDSLGRLGVLCRPHPAQEPPPASADRFLLLEDTDGDGKADRSSVFADHLNHAGAFTFHRDGLLVEQAGDLWLLRDPNHTGKATSRERVLMGFGVADSVPAPGRLVSDPRGAVYWSDAGPHRSRVETGTQLLQSGRGWVLRFEPASGRIEPLLNSGLDSAPGTLLGSWGEILFADTKGQFWYAGSEVYGRAEPLPKQAKWPLLWQNAPAPCTGTAVVPGDHFPPSLQNALLATTSARPSGIRHASPPKGSPEVLLSSDDPSFHPRALSAGPDGALYFADGGPRNGRIYRITAEDRPLSNPTLPAEASVEQLLEVLKSAGEGVREQARHRLGSLPAAATLEALKNWVFRLSPSDPRFERHRLEALWLSRWFGALEAPLLEQALAAREPKVRAQAVRVLAEARSQLPNAMRRLELMATDAHERVRLEVLAAAGSVARTDSQAAVRLVHRVLLGTLDDALERVAKETLRQLEPDPGRMLLPSDPGVLRFVLARLSDAELSKAPPAEQVWLAQLERAGIPVAAKEAALRSLAKHRDTGFVTELAGALMRLDAEDSKASLAAPLLDLLASQQPAGLAQARPALQKLAAAAKPGRLRTAAHAAWLQSAPPAEIWADLQNVPDRQAELLQSLILVPDNALRAACHPIISGVLRTHNNAGSPLHHAALTALPLTGTQFSDANLELLSAPLLGGTVIPEAVQGLAQLPEPTLRKAAFDKLLGTLNAWLATQSGAARETPAFAQALQLAQTLATAWEAQARDHVENLRKQTAPVLVIRTVCDQSRFDVPRLSAQAAQPIRIVFENHDVRPQNLVLTSPGEGETILSEARQKPPSKQRLDGPSGPHVLAASRLLAPGEQQILQLQAPTTPGDYEYLSTAPNQTNIPRGILRILPQP